MKVRTRAQTANPTAAGGVWRNRGRHGAPRIPGRDGWEEPRPGVGEARKEKGRCGHWEWPCASQKEAGVQAPSSSWSEMVHRAGATMESVMGKVGSAWFWGGYGELQPAEGPGCADTRSVCSCRALSARRGPDSGTVLGPLPPPLPGLSVTPMKAPATHEVVTAAPPHLLAPRIYSLSLRVCPFWTPRKANRPNGSPSVAGFLSLGVFVSKARGCWRPCRNSFPLCAERGARCVRRAASAFGAAPAFGRCAWCPQSAERATRSLCSFQTLSAATCPR